MNLEKHLTHPIFQIVQSVSNQMGVKAYVVGGWVRDIILKRDSKDIDIVCLGSGIELAENVAKQIGKDCNVSVFKNFGTAMINFLVDDYYWQIEFVGARKESYNRASRKPIVEDGTLEDDQNRRDFTINAMAISLNKEDYGELIDPFDGLIDIENGIIKTPLDPDITFSDDPLRMFRAIRFATQLNFSIHNETFEAIERNAYRIEILSGERISEELNKIILSPRASMGFKLLDRSGLLRLFFPEMVALKGYDKVGNMAHKDNFKHTLEVLDNVSKLSNNLWLRWAAILHDIAKPLTKRFEPKIGFTFHGHEVKGAKMIPYIFRRMKLPLNENMKYVQKLVSLHLRPQILIKDEVTDSAVRRLLFDAGEDIDDLMKLCHADITTKDHNKIVRYRDNFKKVTQKLEELEEKDRLRNFQPPVSGEDIMQTFGISPCKEIGIIKTIIKDAILDGEIPNEREAALELMYNEAQKLGLKLKK
ncbi:MAG: HD domain-containing protein [Bacteroidales bacterium]|jgi:poly(A) polymerase|nr:HD domain-containing protein [Bacteroidales bacterium]MDD4703020.1 HD domain-containing protein [Bacteroidales bacterium]MDX9798203.1 HD domain-containing protein [Bacteroidales bacterium]